MNSKFIPWVLVAVLLLATGVLFSLYSSANRGKRIAESNEKAALDTTRVSLVGDLAAASHLVQQQEIKVSSLEGALAKSLSDRKADARLVQALTLHIDSLNNKLAAKTGSDTTDSIGIRRATFEQNGPPIEGTQVVTVPPRPKLIGLESHLSVMPFSVRYGLGCDKHHTPVASFETPAWVRTQFDKGKVDPEVCNPKPPGFFSIHLKPTLGNLLYGLVGILTGRASKR